MAVGFDALVAFGTSQNGVTSFNDTRFTVGSGANRDLVVALASEASKGNLPSTPTATWDSVSMTAAVTMTDTRGTSSDINITLFNLAGPNSGNKTLTIAGLNASTDSIVAYISWTGVDQLNPFAGGITNNTGSATSLTATVTAGPSDSAVAIFGSNDGTPSYNNTLWSAGSLTTIALDFYGGCYALNPAGPTVALTMTQGSTSKCNYVAMAVKGVAPGTGVPYTDYVNQPQLSSLMAQRGRRVGWTPFLDPRRVVFPTRRRRGLLIPDRRVVQPSRKIIVARAA